MINELGQSHPGPVLVTNAIISALHSDPQFDVELYWENLDATDISDAMRSELRDSITKKHRKHNLALIVLMGRDRSGFWLILLRSFIQISRSCFAAVWQAKLILEAPILDPPVRGSSWTPQRRWMPPFICCRTHVTCS